VKGGSFRVFITEEEFKSLILKFKRDMHLYVYKVTRPAPRLISLTSVEVKDIEEGTLSGFQLSEKELENILINDTDMKPAKYGIIGCGPSLIENRMIYISQMGYLSEWIDCETGNVCFNPDMDKFFRKIKREFLKIAKYKVCFTTIGVDNSETKASGLYSSDGVYELEKKGYKLKHKEVKSIEYHSIVEV
jgi:hypothetical protein